MLPLLPFLTVEWWTLEARPVSALYVFWCVSVDLELAQLPLFMHLEF